MKRASVILLLFFIFGCTGTDRKTDVGEFDPAVYFPIKDGCTWIYLVGKDGSEKKALYC